MNMNKFSIKDMKQETANFTAARSGLIQGRDSFGNMELLNQTSIKIEGLLKGQQNYIKTFFQADQAKQESHKTNQFKRYLNRFCETLKKQFQQLLKIADSFFSSGKKQKESWLKIAKEFDSKLNEEKEKVTQETVFDFFFKIMNLREGFFVQFGRSMMYRKYLVWNDMNSPTDSFVHVIITQIYQSFKKQEEELGYIPSLPVFVAPNFETPGKWSIFQSQLVQLQQSNSIPWMLKIINQQFSEMLAVIRNYANLAQNQEKFQDINKNQHIIQNLRQKIQVLSTNYTLLQNRYREITSKTEDRRDLGFFKEKVEELQLLIYQKDSQINQLKDEFKESGTTIKSLKDKNEDLQKQITRIQAYQLSKLKELQIVQITLSEQFQKIKKEIGMYSMIYKTECDSKKEIVKELNTKQTQIQKMVAMIGREKKKNKQHQVEIIRLNEIIIELGNQIREEFSDK